jgi:hypothetical protein
MYITINPLNTTKITYKKKQKTGRPDYDKLIMIGTSPFLNELED